MTNLLKIGFNKHKKSIAQAFCFLMATALLFSIYKDINYAAPMHCDLRNRIVGARIMEDGFSPYFYICKPRGLVRYQNFGNYSSVVSSATASPFFHFIIEPIADLAQFQINIIWMFIEYLSLVGCFLLAFFSIDKSNRNKKALLAFTIVTLFTFTIGWRLHVYSGQNYIFIPLLAMASLYCINRGHKTFDILMFAIFSSSLILIRPVTVLFFLPFLFFSKVYFKWGLATFLAIAVYVMFVFYSPVQKINWTDYFKAIPIHINNHQNIAVSNLGNASTAQPFLQINQFEGIDMQWQGNNHFHDNIAILFESSNLYVFYNKYANDKLSIRTMTTIGLLAVVLLLLPLFWFIKHNSYCSPTRLFALGFVIYDVFTFCLPVLRFNYYWVEFLFPLLIIIIGMKKLYALPVLLSAIGLYLNIFAPTWMPARQNVGELLILIAVLSYVYRPMLVACFNESKWKVNNDIYWL